MSQRVLLVDDDEKLRHLVQEYLEGYGFEVFVLPDGDAVLERIRAESPDLVLLDIMLPRKDGLEVLREIRKTYSIPVIMLTAKGEDADRIVGLELGADDYLPKPFNPRELLARIKAVIRRSADHSETDPSKASSTGRGMRRRLRAILSADVKGYSRLMAEDEIATVQTLKTYRGVFTAHIQEHTGRVVDSPGDNILAEFGSVVDAVACALKIQKDVSTRNARLPEDRRMTFRIGINLGDVILEDDRVYGDGVNIAARIEALADPGGLCVSGTVYDQIEGRLSLGYEYMGEKNVKNIRKPVRVYKVTIDQ